jgi:CRP-like cAMP-binding protein
MSNSEPENRLLAALPRADFLRLTAGMSEVIFETKETAYRAGGPINYVYFPRTGVLSAVVVMRDGASAEVGLIGNEGVAGVAAFLGPFQAAVYPYTRGTMAASARTAACNSVHPNVERLARWLLMCHDRVGGDEFPITHEFMALMLGVRRATVTVTAGAIQSAGFIQYRHGQMRILDRAGLEATSCECYAAVRDVFKQAE